MLLFLAARELVVRALLLHFMYMLLHFQARELGRACRCARGTREGTAQAAVPSRGGPLAIWCRGQLAPISHLARVSKGRNADFVASADTVHGTSSVVASRQRSKRALHGDKPISVADRKDCSAHRSSDRRGASMRNPMHQSHTVGGRGMRNCNCSIRDTYGIVPV